MKASFNLNKKDNKIFFKPPISVTIDLSLNFSLSLFLNLIALRTLIAVSKPVPKMILITVKATVNHCPSDELPKFVLIIE